MNACGALAARTFVKLPTVGRREAVRPAEVTGCHLVTRLSPLVVTDASPLLGATLQHDARHDAHRR